MDSGSALESHGNDSPSPEETRTKRRSSLANYVAEQQAVMARVREEGAKRIRQSCDRAVAAAIIDKKGNLLKKRLPADMKRGSDRDFGG